MKMRISIIDFLISSYVIITGSHLILQKEFNTFLTSKWLLFLLCYLIARNVRHKQYCLWRIVVVGATEAIIAFCQKIQWIDTSYSAFNFTGTFANPGPLGGFIAITTTILVGLYLQYRKCRWSHWVLFPVLLLLSVTIVQTDSRAGWLAVSAGIGSFFLKRIQHTACSYIQKSGILLLSVLLLTSIYYYKKDSADGRLLIWHVSLEMITDAPFLGHGVGAFEKQYMHYQGRYFNAHPSSQYVKQADNIAYPYNELLRIGVEMGILGLILVIGTTVCIFKFVPYTNNKIYLGAFVAWFTFSMFSYPSHVLLLWLLLPVLLGGMQCKRSIYIETGYKLKMVKYVSLLVSLIFMIQSGYDYHLLKTNVNQLYSPSPQKVKEAELYVSRHWNEL